MTRVSIFLLLLAVTLPAAARERTYALGLELWVRPREGAELVRFPELAGAVRDWAGHPGARIQIRFPGGEEGDLWASELCDWLVALGVPSSALETQAGSSQGDRIELIVVSQEE